VREEVYSFYSSTDVIREDQMSISGDCAGIVTRCIWFPICLHKASCYAAVYDAVVLEYCQEPWFVISNKVLASVTMEMIV
jgi:hypothetical protein